LFVDLCRCPLWIERRQQASRVGAGLQQCGQYCRHVDADDRGARLVVDKDVDRAGDDFRVLLLLPPRLAAPVRGPAANAVRGRAIRSVDIEEISNVPRLRSALSNWAGPNGIPEAASHSVVAERVRRAGPARTCACVGAGKRASSTDSRHAKLSPDASRLVSRAMWARSVLRRQDSNLDHRNQNPVPTVGGRPTPSLTCALVSVLVGAGLQVRGCVAVNVCCQVAAGDTAY
jgi:hypothetical protein